MSGLLVKLKALLTQRGMLYDNPANREDFVSIVGLSWKQTEQDVSIVLEAQAKLSASDLDPEFTETLVKISLKGESRVRMNNFVISLCYIYPSTD